MVGAEMHEQDEARSRRQQVTVAALLAVATVAVYVRVAGHAFVMFDDNKYVVENPIVRQGLTWDGVRWAFTTGHASNWHPLTWLAHMLDCQLFGLRPGLHHLVNLGLHLANSLLMYYVWQRMTRRAWRSALVAALFALHPLHVESVAWVAERKDMLSTLCWLLTMAAYIRYAERGGVGRYAAVLGWFTLGLLAKPMLVTLPCVLLLLDYWPLGRLRSRPAAGAAGEGPRVRQLLVEKVPLLALSVASSIVTLVVQSRGGAVSSLEAIPLGTRVANALTAYVAYLGKALWPAELSAHYPLEAIPAWQWAGALVLLLGLTGLALGTVRRFPYLAVGWLWYLGTLVPVIGLIQVGTQSMADRYTYVPLIGIFVALVWAAGDLADRVRGISGWLRALAALVLAGCCVASWLQVGTWKNTQTLFEHAIRVNPDNRLARRQLGQIYGEAGQLDQAIAQFREALRIAPDHARTHNNLGVMLRRQGRQDEAIVHFQEALRNEPDYAKAHSNLAAALGTRGDLDEALQHYETALRLAPHDTQTRCNLGLLLSQRGQYAAAMAQYREALRREPASVPGTCRLAWLIAVCPEPALRDGTEAVRLAERAAALERKKSPQVLDALAAAYANQARFAEAVPLAQEAAQLARAQQDQTWAAKIEERVELYRQRRPYREARPAGQ
jgi:Tfp pilus assembly protein PilF